jgi:hypothetical protein
MSSPRQDWRRIAELIVKEQDPDKLHQLVTALCDVFERKEQLDSGRMQVSGEDLLAD